MAQKVIDVVGTSKENFAKAAENAVGRSRKDCSGHEVGAARGGTGNGIGRQEDSQIPDHKKIYFDIESRIVRMWNLVHANESAPDSR